MPPQTPSRSCHVAATAQLSPPNKVGTLELWVRGDFPLKMPSARCHQHANVSSLLGAWQRRPPSINMGHRGKGLDAFSLVLAPQCWSTFAGYPHSLALGRTPRMMGDYGPDSSTSLAALPVSVRCGVPLVASRSRLFCPDGRGWLVCHVAESEVDFSLVFLLLFLFLGASLFLNLLLQRAFLKSS